MLASLVAAETPASLCRTSQPTIFVTDVTQNTILPSFGAKTHKDVASNNFPFWGCMGKCCARRPVVERFCVVNVVADLKLTQVFYYLCPNFRQRKNESDHHGNVKKNSSFDRERALRKSNVLVMNLHLDQHGFHQTKANI
jgi:hypothetical protein